MLTSVVPAPPPERYVYLEVLATAEDIFLASSSTCSQQCSGLLSYLAGFRSSPWILGPPPDNLPVRHRLSQSRLGLSRWRVHLHSLSTIFFLLFGGFGADQRPTRSARPVVVRMARRPFHGSVKMTTDASALTLDPHQERRTRSSPSPFLPSSSSSRGFTKPR